MFIKKLHYYKIKRDKNFLIIGICHFDDTFYHDKIDISFGFDIIQYLKINNKIRNSEIVISTYLSKQILMQFNCKENVKKNIDKSPLWPSNFVGSISHDKKCVVVIVGEKQKFISIGIDIETMMSFERWSDIKKEIIFDNEFSFLSQTKKITQEQIGTLIFSAKESFFKLLYPLINKYFGFDFTRITNINFNKNSFIICLVKDLHVNYRKGFSVCGYFKIYNKQIITLIFLEF